MAKRKVHHRRKRRVSAPKRHHKRRRRMGAPLYASSVGKPRRRRHTAHRRKRRMGAPSGPRGTYKQTMGAAVTELLMLSIGGAIGDIGASVGGKMLETNAGMTPALVEGAKIVVGGGLFVAGGAGIGNNMMGQFVKGVGLGSVVSGTRTLVRMSGILPAMGAPDTRDMYVVLPENGMGAEKSVIGYGNQKLYPNRQIAAEKSVIGGRNIQLYHDVHRMMGL